MKIKSLLSFFVPAALMALSVASCSDYDNGYSEGAIKFTENFRKTFGDIDPEQDWNLAERGTVTVSTLKESDVKIYALLGDEYCIVGHYEGVNGTQMLGFDMVEGTNSIMVTDGATVEKTVPGGVVTFGGTRNVIEVTTGDVKVTKLTSEVTIGEETFPAYRTSNMAEVDKVLNEIVPQGEDNIQKVTSDFTYESTGSFIIYPFYWYTASENTIGVYYTDANGRYHEVDIYESKGSQHGANNTGELWYLMDDQVLADDLEGWKKSNVSNVQGWTSGNLQKPVEIKTDQQDPSGIVAPFEEYWAETALGNATISKTFTVSPNAECLVEVAARLRNQNGTSTSGLGTVTFTANNQSVELTANGNYSAGTYTYDGKTQGNLYSNMNGTGKIMVKCKADSNGKINVSFNLDNVGFNWFSFKDLKIANLDAMTPMGNSEFPGYNSDPSSAPGDRSDDVLAHFFKGQGIRVDILPAGTKFGMYLKKTDDSGTYTFYSESSKNVKDTRLHDKYCYASTFYNGDQMFIGLEDWPNGDSDLNDLVLAFDGCKPTIINEDPEPSSWLLACEDLGATFDIDYNDVVFKIKHISGETKAYLTPLAAGGTLASYIYFEDPNGQNDKVFNEIHQLFGAEPQNSGDYSIINALNSRTEKTCAPIEFTVDKDWSLSFYSSDKYSQNMQYQNVNMGGLEIRTLPKNTPAPNTIPGVNDNIFSGASRIQAPDELGEAPYILCIPASYTRLNMNGYTLQNGMKTEYEWAWPVEFCNITSPYPEFAGWVTDHSTNGEWYKNKNTRGATVEDKWTARSMDRSIKLPSQLGNRGNMTITAGDTPDFEKNLENPNVSSGAITYYIDLWEGSTEYQKYPGGGIFNPGNRKVKVVQAADNTYAEGVTEFILVVNKTGDGEGDSENSSYAFEGKQTNVTLSIEDAGGGKYNVKLSDGTTILSNVSKLKFIWSDNIVPNGNDPYPGNFKVNSPWDTTKEERNRTESGNDVELTISQAFGDNELHQLTVSNNGNGAFYLTIEGS